jgi:hypothetical protein
MTEKKLKLIEIKELEIEIEKLAVKIRKKYTKNKNNLRKILMRKIHLNWTLNSDYKFLYYYDKNTQNKS